jgi:hypothetical protein
MASAALYAAVLAFLSGNSGDLLTSVNADIGGGTLAAGSVNAMREFAAGPRDPNLPNVSVEIVRGPGGNERDVGIGWVETDVILDLYCTVRKKDLPKGQSQLAILDNLTRAIRRRYRGVSNLSITATGATFLVAGAEIREHDVKSETENPARAVVRATFTFLEALGAT